MKKTPLDLAQILLPTFLPPKGVKGEALLCIDIATYLRQLSFEGNLPYVWFHVPNQFSGQYRGMFGALMVWMGRICGIPDYAFLGRDRCFFVEVKTDRGTQSDNQKAVQRWCESIGVPYHICRSLDDMKKVLQEHAR